jgi:hypothetical protein
MLHPYRSIDLYDGKYGVQAIIYGFLLRFRPWYFDGKSVWWDKDYELRSDAEEAAVQLKKLVDK